MKTTIEQLNSFIRSAEGENLEFKQAKMQFDSEKLTRYCVALANEGVGKLILGGHRLPAEARRGNKRFYEYR